MFPAILNLKGVHDHKITIEISEIENISGDEINFDSLLTESQVLKTIVKEQKPSNTRDIGRMINPLSANPTKWSNTLKQFVGNLPTKCLSVFDYFLKLTLKGLKIVIERSGC